MAFRYAAVALAAFGGAYSGIRAWMDAAGHAILSHSELPPAAVLAASLAITGFVLGAGRIPKVSISDWIGIIAARTIFCYPIFGAVIATLTWCMLPRRSNNEYIVLVLLMALYWPFGALPLIVAVCSLVPRWKPRSRKAR